VFLTDRLNSGAVEHSSGAGGLMVRCCCSPAHGTPSIDLCKHLQSLQEQLC